MSWAGRKTLLTRTHRDVKTKVPRNIRLKTMRKRRQNSDVWVSCKYKIAGMKRNAAGSNQQENRWTRHAQYSLFTLVPYSVHVCLSARVSWDDKAISNSNKLCLPCSESSQNTAHNATNSVHRIDGDDRRFTATQQNNNKRNAERMHFWCTSQKVINIQLQLSMDGAR